MKLDIADLKKAVQWVEANSKDIFIRLEHSLDGRNLVIKCQDRLDVQVEITIYADSSLKPRIKKEDAL